MAMRTKKDKRRTVVWILFISIILCYTTMCVYNQWSQILSNRAEKRELEEKYEALLKEEKELTNEITKMQESDYVAKYAREKYGYSKDNEIIIKVED